MLQLCRPGAAAEFWVSGNTLLLAENILLLAETTLLLSDTFQNRWAEASLD